MSKRRVVITGMGALTPLGLTARESWQAVKDGVCGIAPITLFDASAQKVKAGGGGQGLRPGELPGQARGQAHGPLHADGGGRRQGGRGRRSLYPGGSGGGPLRCHRLQRHWRTLHHGGRT